MKLHPFIYLALFAMSSQITFAQAVGNAVYGGVNFRHNARQASFINDSTMMLEVNVMMNVKADSYVAIFGLSQVGGTVDSVNGLMAERINGFVNDLAKLGISKDDVHIDLVSQIPTFEFEIERKRYSRTYNEVPTGFELRKNVHVSYKQPEKLDQIMAEAARREIYDIVKVDYLIDNVDNVYDSMRSTAIRTMNKKVKDMEALGVKFAAIYQTVNEYMDIASPSERYENYSAFSAAVLPQMRKTSSSTTVAVNQARKPVTLYYNRLPYDGYDVIVNPNILEPVMQFTYKLTMKYVLKKG